METLETSSRVNQANAQLMKKIFLMVVFSVFPGVLLSACKKNGQSSDVATALANVDREAREYVRSAIAEPVGDVFELSRLLSEGSVSTEVFSDGFNSSQSEYSSIVAMSGFQRRSINFPEKSMRLETLKIHKSIPKSTIRLEDRNFALQVSLSSKAKVKVFRVFSGEAEAQRTPRVQLVDIPVNLDNALRMRAGDLFVVPVDGQVMTSVDGSFLRHSWSMGRVLDSMLGASLIGETQTGLRANLVVDGRFELHIFKADDERIRVRIFQQNERSMSTEAGAVASLAAKVTVVPLSKLQQISEIKKTLNLTAIGQQRLRLPDVLRKFTGGSILKDSSRNSLAESKKFEDEVRKKQDGLVDLSASIQISAEAIQNQTIARVESMLKRSPGQLNLKVRKIGEKLKVYSDQEIRFDAGVSWTEIRKNKQQFYGDYSFDLRNETGREAFLQAVSGGAVLLSARPDPSGVLKLSRSLHNFVVAERVSRAFLNETGAPVIRLLNGSSKVEVSESQFQIKFGPRMSFALSENWSRENYRFQSGTESGTREGFLNRWGFRQATLFGMASETRERGSGFMSDLGYTAGAESLYWYAQEIDSRTYGRSHLAEFLLTGQNILGPVAQSLNLEKLYFGEVGGRFRGRIVVGIPSTVLDKIFDPSLANESLVWKAVSQVASTFDNTFGLPFLVIPAGMPSSVVGTANEERCGIIATQWGSFYCHYLAQEFIPRLRDAQTIRSTEAKVRFLESFYSKGFGANKIGSDLLARILIQLGLEIEGQFSEAGLLVLIEGRHDGSAASEYNPRVTYGNSDSLRLLEQGLPAW
ncbi:MAG: hypothetical protein ACO3A4_05830 [Silvanigrellaceae bacterium]